MCAKRLAKMMDLPFYTLVILCVAGASFAASITAPIPHVTAVKGETVVLPCDVANVGDHTVVWKSPNSTTLTSETSTLVDDSRISVMRPFTRNWNLYIQKVSKSDVGEYTCEVNTDPVQITTVLLTVDRN